MTKTKLITFLYTFANEAHISGKHILIANLAYLKTLQNKYDCEVYVYKKSKIKTFNDGMLEAMGFKTANDKDLTEIEFDHYAYAGTGSQKFVLPAHLRRNFYPSIEGEAYESLEHMQDNSSKVYYTAAFNYLKDKKNVYNYVIDPLYDNIYLDMKYFYFCQYPDVDGEKLNECPAERIAYYNVYVELIKKFYPELLNVSDAERINDVYANFANVKRFNNKRSDYLLEAIDKGLGINNHNSQFIDSITYMANLCKHRFTLATYSYDPRTFSLLRCLDALALGLVPMVAVNYDDLKNFMGSEFADYLKSQGLITSEPDFDFAKLQSWSDEKFADVRTNLKTLLNIAA
ncbi:hypothetical protein MA9V1_075 [Chryseobacterium phage MA9V-1]|nr:hypothetical protein MA9V1_075 [Chryseobacterium phage MA9V-1]